MIVIDLVLHVWSFTFLKCILQNACHCIRVKIVIKVLLP